MLERTRTLRSALLASTFATLSCVGAPERPEPPSPPPLTTEAPQAVAPAEPRPEPAVSRPAAREVAAPAPAESRAKPEEAPTAGPARPSEAAPEAPAQPAAVDPLQAMQDRQAREEARRVQIAAAEKAVDDARSRVAELEKRLLAVKNPFLPRPVLPPEEAAAWEGLDGAERAKRVEGQLAEARTELETAEGKLAGLRSR